MSQLFSTLRALSQQVFAGCLKLMPGLVRSGLRFRERIVVGSVPQAKTVRISRFSDADYIYLRATEPRLRRYVESIPP